MQLSTFVTSLEVKDQIWDVLVSDTTEYIFYVLIDGSVSWPNFIIFRLMIPCEGETRE